MRRILRRPFWLGCLLLVAFLMVGGELSAQQIPWYVIGSGATATSNGTFTLYGTVGQIAIGTVEGGTTTAYLGFWVPQLQNTTGVEVTDPNPGEKNLRNYPNPFNTTTTVFYEVAQRSQIRIRVYDLSGQLVKNLVDQVDEAGAKQVVWDGTDESGHEVTSGNYVYKMDVQPSDAASGAKAATYHGRMVVVR